VVRPATSAPAQLAETEARLQAEVSAAEADVARATEEPVLGDTPPVLRYLPVRNRHREHDRRHRTPLPVREREDDLGVPNRCVDGDPHGAVEVDASAALVQMTTYSDRRASRLPIRELELGDRMNVIGHPVSGHGRKPVSSPNWRADHGCKILFAARSHDGFMM
jgi:hypothetical protein